MKKHSMRSPLNFNDSTSLKHTGYSKANLRTKPGFVTRSLPVFIIFVLILSVFVCGCNDVKPTEDITDSTQLNTSTEPYVEVTSAKLVSKINGKTPYHQADGYDKFLVLDVRVVNPEGSGHEFPVNEASLIPVDEDLRPDHYSRIGSHKTILGLTNPLDGYISEGEILSGELVYEVRDELNYKYVWLKPDDVDLGIYDLPEIVSQPEY